MINKRKKNFRAILLKESFVSQPFSPKKNLFLKSQKMISKTTSTNSYSKAKENKNISCNLINNSKNAIQSSSKNIHIFDNNDRYEKCENSKEYQFPKILNSTNTNYIENKMFKSLDYSNYKSSIRRTESNKKFKLPFKKSLFRSFEDEQTKSNKIINQKYIRLSKVFEKNSKFNIFNYNIPKSSSKDKSIKFKLEHNKGYNNYIINRLKSGYNKNFDSSFIHKINTEYMLKLIKKKDQIILNNAKKYKYANTSAELLLEERDKVDDKNLGKVKIFNKIRNYLINQYKGHIIGKEAKQFYSKKENLINFLYDINLLPNFKNNLIKQTYNSNKLDQKNFIEHNNLRYLNIAKIKIQKNKDIKNTSEYIQEQINEEEKIDVSKIELDKNYTEKYDLYDMEDYLTKKKINQSQVKILDDKEKYYFYNTFMKIHGGIEVESDECFV